MKVNFASLVSLKFKNAFPGGKCSDYAELIRDQGYHELVRKFQSIFAAPKISFLSQRDKFAGFTREKN